MCYVMSCVLQLQSLKILILLGMTQTRNNSELVGIFGNFINRMVVLTNKYWDGFVPNKNNLTAIDEGVLLDLVNMMIKLVGILKILSLEMLCPK